MLNVSNLCAFPQNSSLLNHFVGSANPRFLRLVSLMASSKVVAEYAKSGRSSCKKCDKKIDASALRLGLVSRDARGFDLTKWYHLDCFPKNSESIASAQAIKGLSSLKSNDQETLKRLLDESALSAEKVRKRDDVDSDDPGDKNLKKKKVALGDDVAIEGSKEKISKSSTVREREDVDSDDLKDEKSEKTTKVSVPNQEAKLDIHFSISDIKDKYQDAKLLPEWKAFQTVIFLERDDGLHDSEKIAAFDFDGCLVNTSVKRVGPNAWSLMYSSVPEKLQSLYNEGYKLVIFTNESNIDRWKNKRQVAVDSKIGRLNNFIKHVKVPIQVFIACGIGKSAGKEDPFRKPKPGMWHLMKQQFNSGISIDMDQSFYVGDAAGRPEDHSDADVKFAKAIGLKFYVPEEYFSA